MKFTAVFEKVAEGYTAFVEELPGALPKARRLKRREPISGKPSICCSMRIGWWRRT